MAAKKATPTQKKYFIWRGLTVCALTIAAIVFLTVFLIIHWVERQILTTDNWVATVSPIPKDDAVASALSKYTVDSIFTATDLEKRVSQALPDKASFLAPSIADQLHSRLTNRTKQIIQSDSFQSVWARLNQAASQRLLSKARGESTGTASKQSRFDLDLGPIKDIVTNLLAPNPPPASTTDQPVKEKKVSLGVNLKTSANKLATYIKMADFLNAILGLAALVCLLGALALSLNRRRLLVIVSLIVTAIGLLQLIGVKSLRPAVLNSIQDSTFRPAVSVVYDTLLNSFNHTATLTAVIGLLTLIICYFTRPTLIERSKTAKKQLKIIKNSYIFQQLHLFRKWVRQHLLQIIITIILIGLAILAFAAGLNAQGLIRGALFILLFIEVTWLVAYPTRAKPM